MTYLFSYDVADTRRRNQIAKALEQFGLRVQKSIFQCDILPAKADELKIMLRSIIDENEDSLLFYPLCDSCLEKAYLLGNKTLLQNLGFEIL